MAHSRTAVLAPPPPPPPPENFEIRYRTGGKFRAIPDFALFRQFCGY